MKRLLVTGRHGFVGGTMARLIAAEPSLGSWRMVDVPPTLQLRDAEAATALVKEAPDAVIHLAQSGVPNAFRNPESTLQVAVLGTLNLLQALRRTGFRRRVVFVSTADLYGRGPDNELPIKEDRLPAPRNAYAVTKLAAEALCYQRSATEGVARSMRRFPQCFTAGKKKSPMSKSRLVLRTRFTTWARKASWQGRGASRYAHQT